MNELSTSWHAYGKVFALGHKNIQEIFQDSVIIEEKIDGSSCHFCKLNGELLIRSRNQVFDINAPQDMFANAAETVKELAPLLHEGWTYRGEYLSKPKHNTLAYNRIPVKHIIIFDIATGHETYLSYEEKAAEANRLGLEVVPKIYEGKIDLNAPDLILNLLNRQSILGGQKIEGVVVKNYNRFGADGKILLGKYVSESFKEVHEVEWKKTNPKQGDILAKLKERYKSEARWHKAVQRLKDRGEFSNDVKDIGNVMKEAQADIEEECQDEIKEMLYSWASKEILRHSVRGVPEWFKEQLLRGSFE